MKQLRVLHQGAGKLWAGKRRGFPAPTSWHSIGNAKWVFAARAKEDGWITLTNHGNTHIKRFTKVRGQKSPYDADWFYWEVNHPYSNQGRPSYSKGKGGNAMLASCSSNLETLWKSITLSRKPMAERIGQITYNCSIDTAITLSRPTSGPERYE